MQDSDEKPMTNELSQVPETTADEGGRGQKAGVTTGMNVVPFRPRPDRKRADDPHGAFGDGTGASKRPSAAGRQARSSVRRPSRTDAREHLRSKAHVGDLDPADDATGTALDTASPVHVSADILASRVREQVNAAARPIFEAFARGRGIPLRPLQKAIDGPAPLTNPRIMLRLGGALHSEAMRNVIASHADPALVPLKVRAGLAKMLAQDLTDPRTVAVRKEFPDWNKPLTAFGQRIQPWQPRDAAAWLRRFPPIGRLLHPMDTWDGATAALWLNDRETILSGLAGKDEADSTLVAFESSDPWKPSLEVLHTLDELELEALAYRVFVERLRREAMPSYVSERRIQVRKAIELVTFGYQTLQEARRSMRIHDHRRIRSFSRVFDENQEWIYDLCHRIVAAYAWPDGFTEPELWSEFPDLHEAPQ